MHKAVGRIFPGLSPKKSGFQFSKCLEIFGRLLSNYTSLRTLFSAALPPDVRQGCALPGRLLTKMRGSASRGAAQGAAFRRNPVVTFAGRAQPVRTSGGKAAEKQILTPNFPNFPNFPN
ncbi:MAG: hypothetical protein JSS81_26725 [Acidobacteria bacterium]|nr:hypothetical protein [Acidobacteriota bacterium]